MKIVHRADLAFSDRQEILLPKEFEVIAVGLSPNGHPSLWAEVDPEDEVGLVTLRVIGTGDELPDKRKHLGSFANGPFMWHVYSE